MKGRRIRSPPDFHFASFSLTAGEGLIIRFPANPTFLGTTHLEMLLLLPKELTPHPESLPKRLLPNHMTPRMPQTHLGRGCHDPKADSELLFPLRYGTAVLRKAEKEASPAGGRALASSSGWG